MQSKHILAGSLAALALAAGSLSAAPITGTPSAPNPFGWTPNSTNELNYNQQTPSRVDQVAPYVVLDSQGIGELTLAFNNGASGLAFFEIRIDGIATGATAHPVVTGDTIHTGGIGVASGILNDIRSFTAASTVEVRLALGAERDWDFDWTSFSVLPRTAVPTPGALGLLMLGLAGIAAGLRRKAT